MLLLVLLLACTLFLDEILMKIYYKFAVKRCNELCNWTEEELAEEYEREINPPPQTEDEMLYGKNNNAGNAGG